MLIIKRMLILLIFILSSCDSGDEEYSKKEISSSKKYVSIVTVQLETEKAVKAGEGKKKRLHVWFLSIHNAQGKLIYEDKTSKFYARFNVYTGWDKEDSFWLYNSDDGEQWKWFLKGGKWIKEKSLKKEMPKELLPHYEQNKAKSIR